MARAATEEAHPDWRSAWRAAEELTAEEEQKIAALGHWVHVYIDRTSRRPVPIPDAIRSLLSTASVS